MSKVVITHDGVGQTQVEVDGQVLREVTGLQLNFAADSKAELHVGMNLAPGFKYEGDVEVHLHLHVLEGTKMLDVSTHQDAAEGKKKFIVVAPEDQTGGIEK